ncbi:hypothetical protein UlMin_028201 [Ulmus minor]
MSMSSSSAPAADPSLHKFDVFISFRGETRNSFTSHLYSALCGKQIKTYIDEVSLEKGDDISRALPKAIEESTISIIIFSENYASSRWCLDELVHILKCRKENDQYVMPIFYGIDPSDIRRQKESYAAAFVKHEARYGDKMEKVQEWREALTQAANLSGWDSRNRSESIIVKEVVELVRTKLETIWSIGNEDLKGLIGIERRLEKIESLLCIGSPTVCIVGIWGMGGIGKTTIAPLGTLGSSLYSMGIKDWERALTKLNRIPNKDIQEVLRISYERLDAEEQGIFLDIACFFKRQTRDFVEGILDHKPIIGLVHKSLITIENGRIGMHDLIQEMGWEIVRESTKKLGERSRLWNAQDVYYVLKKNKGTEEIEGIYLEIPKIEEDLCLRPEVFEEMCNLRVLKIYSENCKLEQLWDGVQKFGSLKNINLMFSQNLTKIPDLSLSPKLVSINFSSTGLIHVPSLNLQATLDEDSGSTGVSLSFNSCHNLKTISEVRGNITELDLSFTALEELPSSIESLENFLRLHLYLPRNIEIFRLEDVGLEQIPSSSIEHLYSLKDLSLEGCKSLESLLSNIWKLHSLEKINLEKTSIQELPSSIENLIGIKYLSLRWCEDLRIIPDTLCQLTRLQELSLLKKLDISYCKNLHSLPELPLFIESLNAKGCSSLEMVSTSSSEISPENWHEKNDIAKIREFIFLNCYRLGENTINKITTEFLYRVFCTATTPREVILPQVVALCYPRKKIPKWFKYQSMGSSTNIRLPTNWYDPKTFLGFIVSVVVAGNFIKMQCELQLKRNNGETLMADVFEYSYSSELFVSNMYCYPFIYNSISDKHVVMWYIYFDHSKAKFEQYQEASFDFEESGFESDWNSNGVFAVSLEDSI